MKNVSIIAVLIIGLFSCNNPRDIDKEVKNKITEFYTVLEVKNYKSISYSELDTIDNIINLDSSLIKLTGTIEHTFSANSNNGILNQYTDTFDVAIFENSVYALPRGYE